MSALVIGGPGQPEKAAEPGDRVARWHQTYAAEADPVPGTIVRVGARFLTVNFDGIGERRIEPRNVTRWSEPADA